jgi:hypothetical protein
MSGFRVRERMVGWHEFTEGRGPTGRAPLSFEGTWGPESVRDWVDPRKPTFLWQEMEGTLTAGGLCDGAPFHGTLALEYFGLRRIRYTLDFEAGGRTLRLVGDKENLRWWNLAVSHSTCFVTVTDLATSCLISRGVVLFRLRDLPGLLRVRRAA